MECVHEGKRKYRCVDCDKRYDSQGKLNFHVIKFHNHKGIKNHVCDICYKEFTRPYELKIHYDVHKRSGELKCDFCEKSFAHKSNKLAHVKQSHLGKKRNYNNRKSSAVKFKSGNNGGPSVYT